MLRRVKNVLPPFLMLLALVACGRSSSRAEPGRPLAYIERVINAAPDATLPMLIVLHGLGGSPEEFIEVFAGLDMPLRIIAPRAPDTEEQGKSWFPIDEPRLAPQGIVRRAELVAQLTDKLVLTRPTQGRPIVTGFSQGGILSFALAAYHPASFQAALPMAGALLDSLPRYQRAPDDFHVAAFHGVKDERVPYDGDQRTIARLKAVGTEATLTSFPGLGHTMPQEMLRPLFVALKSELARSPKLARNPPL